MARDAFPYLADTLLRQPSFSDIAPHHDGIAQLLDVVPVSAAGWPAASMPPR